MENARSLLTPRVSRFLLGLCLRSSWVQGIPSRAHSLGSLVYICYKVYIYRYRYVCGLLLHVTHLHIKALNLFIRFAIKYATSSNSVQSPMVTLVHLGTGHQQMRLSTRCSWHSRISYIRIPAQVCCTVSLMPWLLIHVQFYNCLINAPCILKERLSLIYPAIFTVCYRSDLIRRHTERDAHSAHSFYGVRCPLENSNVA